MAMVLFLACPLSLASKFKIIESKQTSDGERNTCNWVWMPFPTVMQYQS